LAGMRPSCPIALSPLAIPDQLIKVNSLW